jgi:hypothetical protein
VRRSGDDRLQAQAAEEFADEVATGRVPLCPHDPRQALSRAATRAAVRFSFVAMSLRSSSRPY